MINECVIGCLTIDTDNVREYLKRRSTSPDPAQIDEHVSFFKNRIENTDMFLKKEFNTSVKELVEYIFNFAKKSPEWKEILKRGNDKFGLNNWSLTYEVCNFLEKDKNKEEFSLIFTAIKTPTIES